MHSGAFTTEEKDFQQKKVQFFLSLSSTGIDLHFFTKIFILQRCLDPNPCPNPNFFSDSDPAKTGGFFRIRIQNT
jgi:hypothetical protein